MSKYSDNNTPAIPPTNHGVNRRGGHRVVAQALVDMARRALHGRQQRDVGRRVLAAIGVALAENVVVDEGEHRLVLTGLVLRFP